MLFAIFPGLVRRDLRPVFRSGEEHHHPIYLGKPLDIFK
jgi:hypothetical protein